MGDRPLPPRRSRGTRRVRQPEGGREPRARGPRLRSDPLVPGSAMNEAIWLEWRRDWEGAGGTRLGAVLGPERDRQTQQREPLLERLDVARVLAQRDLPGLLASLQRAHLLEVALVQPLPEPLRRFAGDRVDAEAGQRLQHRRPQPHQVSSATPALRLASRARTKRRSE